MSNQRERSAQQYATWRAQGVPTLITSNEAWLLTDGAYGKQGDNSTPVNLSTVASKVTA